MANATMIAAVAVNGPIGAVFRYGFSLSFGARLFGIAWPLAALLVRLLPTWVCPRHGEVYRHSGIWQ